MKTVTVSFLLIMSMLLIACGPSQAELDSQATKIAANIFATQTAKAPTTTPTPVPPTSTPDLPTETPTPEELALEDWSPFYTATVSPSPTPSYPAFSKDEVLEIPSISAIVGEGYVVFTAGEEPGKLTVEIRGTIPIVEGYWCVCCVETITIAPNLKVPLTPFFLDTEAPPAPGGLISESMGMDVVLSSPISEEATEFILSGPEGATLTKVGQGFLLVEGAAYYVQTTLP